MSEKIYAGTGRIVKTAYGDLTKISFSKTDLEKLLSLVDEQNVWVTLLLKEKKEKVPNKPTHYLEVDTWKPTPQGTSAPAQPIESNNDNLPF